MKSLLIGAIGIASALSVVAGPAQSALVFETTPSSCLRLMLIDHTQVVDDQNILFYTRSGSIYLNQLKHPVPGLGPNRPFMYQIRVSQICRNDSVTVLEERGFGFLPGATGILGDFQPIDEARASQLTGSAQVGTQLEPAATK